MLEPYDVINFKDFNDVLESDLEIIKITILSPLVYPKYFEIKNNTNRIVDPPVKNMLYLRNLGIAFFRECKIFDSEVTHMFTYLGMTKVPTPVYSQLISFYTGPYSPFINELQDFMDLVAAAGLYQPWFTFYDIDAANYYNYWIFKRLPDLLSQLETENIILDLDAIGPFFVILAAGFLFALLTLIGEIFYHDFLKNLSLDYFKNKILTLFKRH